MADDAPAELAQAIARTFTPRTGARAIQHELDRRLARSRSDLTIDLPAEKAEKRPQRRCRRDSAD